MPQQQFDEFSGLRAALAGTKAVGSGFAGGTRRFISNTESLAPERSRLGGGLSALTSKALASEKGGTSFASSLGASTRVAKARQGIQNRGESAIRNQQLKDRIAIARLGIQKRGRGLRAMANAANIREGVNLANANAEAAISASNADLLGGILGSGAALLKDKFGKKPSTETETQLGRGN